MKFKRTSSPLKRGYLLHSILFFVLILSLADSLLRRATSICPYRKLKDRQEVRFAIMNLRERTSRELLASHNQDTVNKSSIIGKAATTVRTTINGLFVDIYYESSCGGVLQQTLDSIGPGVTESISTMGINRKQKTIENEQIKSHFRLQETINRNKHLKQLLQAQAKTAEMNFNYLKDIRKETIEKLYKLKEPSIATQEKWKKEINKGATSALENLKSFYPEEEKDTIVL